MWTIFWDMHSGGGQKEKWSLIFIEAPEEEATTIFYNRFGHNPNRVSCTCCGEDYSVSSEESLEQITAYHRGCDYGENGYVERPNPKGYKDYASLEDFMKKEHVLVVSSEEIKPEEREGHV